MPKKAQNLLQRYLPYLRQLEDIRLAGLVLFVILVLLVSWSGVKSIDTNYHLQKQIAALQQKNDLQELSNKNLQLQNEYYKSDQYLDLAARQNFGLAAPGETELIVPKSVALSHIVQPPASKKPTAAGQQPAWQRNFQAWINFFLHRPQS